jgi:hypothetical protein
MLIFEECRLAVSKGNKFELVCGYTDFNKIGDKGCEHLSKASWPLLQKIDLGNYFMI